MTAGQPSSLPYKVIEPPAPKPILTVLWICCLPLFLNNGNINWVETNSFSPSHMSELLAANNLAGVFSYMYTAAFAQLSPWIWLLNSFFIWAFGYVVEKKLKAWRYPLFLTVSLFGSWFCVYALAGPSSGKIFVGPSMMLFCMLGAYFAFFPKQAFRAQQWVRPNTEIFRVAQEKSLEERYWISPWLYVTAFVIYQVVLQLALNYDKDFIVNTTHVGFLADVHTFLIGRLQVQPSAFSPPAAIAAIGLGFVVAYMLPRLAVAVKPVRPGGKLQLEVIQHYRELRTLDMTHEQACEGAAKFAAVPIDIARDWISKGAAGLKDQDLK